MGEENFQIVGADGTRLRPLRGLRPGNGRKRGQPPTTPFRSRAFLRKRHCGTAKRAARDLTGGTMFLP